MAPFIKLATNEPRFLRRQLLVVVGTIFEIAEDEISKNLTRHLAVEILIALVMARKKAPGMMKKLPLFTSKCFAVILKLLADIKDEPSWHSAETKHQNAGLAESYLFGNFCLKLFADALGGKTIVPIAIEQLYAYLVAPEWEKRHTSLIALLQIAGRTSKVILKYLEQVVNLVLHSLRDPHPQVRWAAISAIEQLSVNFCPDLQEQYYNQVLPALAGAMDDFQNPQVQAHAASAVVSFFKSGSPETFVPYVDGILNKVLVLLQYRDHCALQNGNQMVQEAALLSLAAIAELSNVMEVLQSLQKSQVKELDLLFTFYRHTSEFASAWGRIFCLI